MPIELWPALAHLVVLDENSRLQVLGVDDSTVQEIHVIDEHESARAPLGRHAEVRLYCTLLCVDLLCTQHTQRTAGQQFSVHPNGCCCCTMRGHSRSRDRNRIATLAYMKQGPSGHANMLLER